jgi:hypothetical protein
MPAPANVGLQRLNFDQREFAGMSHDRAKQKYTALAKRVETYLARMGMPKKLFQEMTQQSSDKVLLLDAGRLKTLGLDGTDPAYEQWMRANTISNRRNQTENDVSGCAPDYSQARMTKPLLCR